MASDERRPVGRPRDETMDQRALAATAELLAEVGFTGTTVQAVAARSGVHASAIYRRWSSRIELIEDAVFPGLDAVAVTPTGDLTKDLRRFIRAYLSVLGTPVASAAIPGLLAHYQSAGPSRSPEAWLPISARPQFQDIVCAAPPGSIDERVDVDDVFDVLLSAVLGRVLVPTIARRNRPVERLVEMVLRLLRPADDLSAAARPAGRGRPTREVSP